MRTQQTSIYLKVLSILNLIGDRFPLSHHCPWLHWFCDVPIPSLLFAESPMFIELGGQQKSQLEDNLREELSQALCAHVGPKGWVSLGSTVG